VTDFTPEWRTDLPTSSVVVHDVESGAAEDPVVRIGREGGSEGVFRLREPEYELGRGALVELSANIGAWLGLPNNPVLLNTGSYPDVYVDLDASIDDVPEAETVRMEPVPEIDELVATLRSENALLREMSERRSVGGETVSFDVEATVPERASTVRVTDRTAFVTPDGERLAEPAREEQVEDADREVESDGLQAIDGDETAWSETEPAASRMEPAAGQVSDGGTAIGESAGPDAAGSTTADQSAEGGAEDATADPEAPDADVDVPDGFLDAPGAQTIPSLSGDDIQVDVGREEFVLFDGDSVVRASKSASDELVVPDGVRDIASGVYDWVITDTELHRVTTGGTARRLSIDRPLQVETLRDEESVAVVTEAGDVKLFDEDTLREEEAFPLPGDIDTDEIQAVSGGFSTLAIAAGRDLVWYSLGEFSGYRTELESEIRDLSHFEDTVLAITEERTVAYAANDADNVRWTLASSPSHLSTRSRRVLFGVVDDTVAALARDGTLVSTGVTVPDAVVHNPSEESFCVVDDEPHIVEYDAPVLAFVESEQVDALEPEIGLQLIATGTEAWEGELELYTEAGSTTSEPVTAPVGAFEAVTVDLPQVPSERANTPVGVALPDGTGIARAELEIDAEPSSTALSHELEELADSIRTDVVFTVEAGRVRDVEIDGTVVADELDAGETVRSPVTIPAGSAPVEVPVEYRDAAGVQTDTVTVGGPESPLEIETSTQRLEESVHLRVDCRNRSNVAVDDAVTVDADPLPESIDATVGPAPGERTTVVVPFVREFDDFTVTVRSRNGFFEPVQRDIGALSPLSVRRRLRRARTPQADDVDPVPTGHCVRELLELRNVTDGEIPDISVASSEGGSLPLGALEPGETATHWRDYSSYEGTIELPEYEISSGDVETVVPDEALGTTREVVVRAWISVEPAGGTVGLSITNDTERSVSVDGLEIHETGNPATPATSPIGPGESTDIVVDIPTEHVVDLLGHDQLHLSVEFDEGSENHRRRTVVGAVGTDGSSNFFGAEPVGGESLYAVRNDTEYTLQNVRIRPSGASSPTSLEEQLTPGEETQFRLTNANQLDGGTTVHLLGDLNGIVLEDTVRVNDGRVERERDSGRTSGPPSWFPETVRTPFRRDDGERSAIETVGTGVKIGDEGADGESGS